jgi:hypothetical protein
VGDGGGTGWTKKRNRGHDRVKLKEEEEEVNDELAMMLRQWRQWRQSKAVEGAPEVKQTPPKPDRD